MFDPVTHFLFPTHAVPQPGPLPRGAELLEFTGASGDRLVAVRVPASKLSPRPVLILGFGGNGWNAQDVAEYLHGVFPDDDVMSVYYRGYPPSAGEPSAEGIVADAPAAYDFAVGQVKPSKVIAVGFSIGSGVASALSAERHLDGVILVTPFDSLRAVAQDAIPWIPLGPLFRHDLEAAKPLEKSRARTAILAGERDDLVRPARTDALRQRVPNLVFDKTIPRAGHNDIYARSDFQEALRAARERLIS